MVRGGARLSTASFYLASSETNGIDLFTGRRLPRLLHAAGLIEVQVQPLSASGDRVRRGDWLRRPV